MSLLDKRSQFLCARSCAFDADKISGGIVVGFLEGFVARLINLLVALEAVLRTSFVEERRIDVAAREEESSQLSRRSARTGPTRDWYSSIPSGHQMILTLSLTHQGACMFSLSSTLCLPMYGNDTLEIIGS